MLTKKANMFCDSYLSFLYGDKVEAVKKKAMNVSLGVGVCGKKNC